MPAQLSDHDFVILYYNVAPWMVGCFLDLFTQGILVCQFNNYIAWYKDDKIALRLAVYVLIVLTSLKLIDSCANVWIAFVDNFMDLEAAANLSYFAWHQTGAPLMGACINLYAQLYFLYRLSAISKRHWIVYPMGLVIVFAWLAVVIATVYITLLDADRIQYWFAAHLGATFASDILVTVVSAFFLLKSKKNSLRQTQALVDTLVRITWQSAAPAALCATLNLILSQAVSQEWLLSTVPNLLLPKVYSIAMMWTINSRKGIRLINASGKTGSSEGTSNPLSRAARTGELELGRIQVHRQTDTVSHVDWQAKPTSDEFKSDAFYGRQPTITIHEQISADDPRAI